MSLAKLVLHRLGLLRLASQARNGTWRYLRRGYAPRGFWEAWGEKFSDQKYQQDIHAGQRWLLERLRQTHAVSWCELGCGFGRNLGFLSRELGPGRGYGVDISGSLLRRARRGLPEACGLACADLGALPFRARAFDTVFTHGVLMHLPPAALPAALAEIKRIARGAILLVEETYWEGMPRAGVIEVNGYTFFHDYPKALAAAGLEILEASESGGSVNLACFRCRP